ncbi:MAG: hypothetical protein AB7F40_11230 [Victivallaceae bacterium]|nr:hypothetical protein [Victivallaceae bacterium]
MWLTIIFVDMNIYFDNAAAMPPDPRCGEWLAEILRLGPVNQESTHAFGRRTRELLAESESRLLAALCPSWKGGRVIFAPSGSDALNVLPYSYKWNKGRARFSDFEHPAARRAAERAGGELAVYTHVQSELGLFCVPENGKLVVCDTIQSAGKLELPSLPDILTVSGHKLGAPGGAALLVNPACKLELDFDAPRHRDYLVGRPEPVQIMLMVRALEEAVRNREENLDAVSALNRFLRDNLPRGVMTTLPFEQASPYILHLRILGRQGAIVARMLSNRGIMTSPSSACQAEAGGPSAALTALGLRGKEAYEGLRLSFSPLNTMAEAEIFLRILTEELTNY